MRKLLKYFGIITAILLLIVVAVFGAATILITPERVRQTIVPIVEKSLNRPVSIGQIDVRLFSGIAIEDFTVRSKDGKTDFVTADALILNYRFWPLFKLRVVLDEARLDGPTIRVVRFENGTFNFSDLLAVETQPEDSVPAEPPPPESTVGGPVIDLRVNKLGITAGKLLFTDRAVAKQPLTYQLEDLTITATDVSPGNAFPITVESRINKAPFSLYGTVNPQTQFVDLRILLDNFDVSEVMPYLADSFPGTLSSLLFSLNSTLKGDMNAIDTSGEISARQVDLTLAALPGAPVKNAEASLSYAVSVNMGQEKVSIHKADAELNGIPLSVTGSIDRYGTNPHLELRTILPMTPLAAILAAVPKKLTEPFAGMNPGGQLAADIQLAGAPDQLENFIRKGTLTLDDIRFTSGDLPVKIAGQVLIEKASVRGKGLILQIADSPATLEFTATNIMETPIRVTHSLQAQTLNLDEILAAAGSDRKKPPSGKPPASAPSESKSPPQPQPEGPIDLPLTVDGAIRVTNAIYHGLNVSNFELLYLLENNIFTVNQVRGDVAGGTISGTGKADLNQQFITYAAEMSIEGTQTDPIVSALYPPAAKTLFGNLFLKFNMNGRGINPDAIMESITGKADLRITDGRLTGTGITKGLAAYLDAEKLEVLSFKAISGDVQLEGGNFKIDSAYAAKDLRMAPKGTIGLDGSIDLSLNLRLAPELAARIDGNEIVSQLLKNQEGWAVIPLNVAGSLSAPKFSLDKTVVQQMLREKAVKGLQDQLREKLLKPDKPGQTPNPAKKSTTEETSETTGPEDKTGKEKQPSVEQMLKEELKKLIR